MPKWQTWTFSRQSPTPPHHRRLWHCSKRCSSRWGGSCARKDVRQAHCMRNSTLDSVEQPPDRRSRKTLTSSRVVCWVFHPLLVPALDQLLAALHTHPASRVEGIDVRVPRKWNKDVHHVLHHWAGENTRTMARWTRWCDYWSVCPVGILVQLAVIVLKYSKNGWICFLRYA